MVAHAGFAHDFDDFRRQGEIGMVPRLQIRPTHPEIGTEVNLEVAGLLRGRLRCSDGRAWDFQDGERCRLRVCGRLHLQLLDEYGRIEAEATVEPWFDRPELNEWCLPASLPWDLGAWHVPAPQVDSVHDLSLFWRPGPQEPWQPVSRSQPLPLRPARGRIGLRAVLRSRHAAFTRQAVLIVEREVEIVPPLPVLDQPFDSTALECHTPRSVVLVARHVRSLQLMAGELTVARAAGEGGIPLTLECNLLANVCGILPLRLLAVDLDGSPCELLTQSIHVLPRPVRVQIEKAAGELDTLRVEVFGAAARAVSIPNTGEYLPNLPERFLLSLQAAASVTVLIELKDDAGKWVQHTVQLCQQPMPWLDLPAWSAVPDPNW